MALLPPKIATLSETGTHATPLTPGQPSHRMPVHNQSSLSGCDGPQVLTGFALCCSCVRLIPEHEPIPLRDVQSSHALVGRVSSYSATGGDNHFHPQFGGYSRFIDLLNRLAISAWIDSCASFPANTWRERPGCRAGGWTPNKQNQEETTVPKVISDITP